MFIMQVLASQLHFLANRNAELAAVNCIEIGGHVALLSCPSLFFLLYVPAKTYSYSNSNAWFDESLIHRTM